MARNATVYGYEPVVAALLFTFLLLIAARVTGDVRLALLSVFLTFVTSLILPHAKYMWSEMTSALMLTMSVQYTLAYHDHRRKIALVAASLASVALVWNNLVFAPLVAAQHLFLLATVPKEGRRTLALVGGFLASLTVVQVLGYNQLRYGQLWGTGYDGEGFTSPIHVGLAVLLLSPGRSLLIYSAVTVASVALFLAYPRVLPSRPFRQVYAFTLAAFLAYLLLYSAWHGSDGGWCWGPRFLLPFVPVLNLAFAIFLLRRRRMSLAVQASIMLAVVWGGVPNLLEHTKRWWTYELEQYSAPSFEYFRSVIDPRLTSWVVCGYDALDPDYLRFALPIGLAFWILWRTVGRRTVSAPRGSPARC